MEMSPELSLSSFLKAFFAASADPPNTLVKPSTHSFSSHVPLPAWEESREIIHDASIEELFYSADARAVINMWNRLGK
jgi:hypothetical protein